jgi:hypothetical protein
MSSHIHPFIYAVVRVIVPLNIETVFTHYGLPGFPTQFSAVPITNIYQHINVSTIYQSIVAACGT